MFHHSQAVVLVSAQLYIETDMLLVLQPAATQWHDASARSAF